MSTPKFQNKEYAEALDAFCTVQMTDHFSEFELEKNGLRVVLIPYSSPTQTLSCTMNYHVGSYDERVSFTGSAHYLEHLLFKDPLKGNKQNIFQTLDQYGANINATTSDDRINFLSTIPNNVFSKWVAAEAQRVQYMPFDIKNRDKKESAVVVDELRMGNDNPFKKLTEAVMGAAFDRSGYNHMTSGYIQDVENTTQENLAKFWKNFFGPNNCTMVIVGNINTPKVLKEINKHFGDIPARPVIREDRSEIKQEGPRQVFVYTKKPYTMCQIAFRNMEGVHPDSITLDLIAELMQFPKIGILSVLKEAHVVPSYNVRNNRNLHRHLFQITTALASPEVVKVLTVALWKWFDGVAKQEIDANTLKLAKLSLKNKWNKIYDGGVESIGAAATEAVAMGNINDLFDKQSYLDKVTTEDINRVANYIFQNNRCTVGVLCPQPSENVSRPLQSNPEYNQSLMCPTEVELETSVGVDHMSKIAADIGRENMARYKCAFGVLQHLQVPSSKQNKIIISTSAFDKNVSLGEIACKIINEGIDKVAEVESAHTLLFGSNNSKTRTFNTFKIEKNLDFKIYSSKGRISVIVSFDNEHDTKECLTKIASAIKSLPELSQNDIMLKVQACAGEWSGQMHDVNAATHQKITEAMFDEQDNNYILGAKEKITMVQAITKSQLQGFLSNLFDNERPFVVTAISNEKVKPLCKAITAFRNIFSKDQKELVPFTTMKSKAKEIKSEVIRIPDPGREDGVVAIGIRIPVSRTSKQFTALRLASDVLGDGIYSRLNLPLRVEKGLTYGTYSRIRGGHHGSDSYMHIFGSFKVSNLDTAKELIDGILDNFVMNGITQKEFDEKKNHLKNSIKVRMDNVNNMFMMHHQTFLNGNEMTYNKILQNIKDLNIDDVNDAINKYLLNQPRITVIGGV